MDFIDELRQFSERAKKMLPQINSEEATKTGLIMPFFQKFLGYDVFDINEFVPEFVADFGTKKNDRVDYAIIKEGKPVILIEAKWCGATLESCDSSQLSKYFSATTDAKFGILTNGITYRFYADLDTPYKMDSMPFLVFDLLHPSKTAVTEVMRFRKETFDTDGIRSRALMLKYTNEIEYFFLGQFREPSDAFVKFTLSQTTYKGKKWPEVIERFRPIVKSAIRNIVDQILNTHDAINAHVDSLVDETPETQFTRPEGLSENEERVFGIVKTFVSGIVDVSKLTYNRSPKGMYLFILVDGCKICQFEFGKKQNWIGVPAADGNIVFNTWNAFDGLSNYKSSIVESARRALGAT